MLNPDTCPLWLSSCPSDESRHVSNAPSSVLFNWAASTSTAQSCIWFYLDGFLCYLLPFGSPTLFSVSLAFCTTNIKVQVLKASSSSLLATNGSNVIKPVLVTELWCFCLFWLVTVNTGIVNHTHSRMGSIMSTGIVQGETSFYGSLRLSLAAVLKAVLCSLHQEPPRVSRAPAAAVLTILSPTSSPWGALPSPWLHLWSSPATPCTMAVKMKIKDLFELPHPTLHDKKFF